MCKSFEALSASQTQKLTRGLLHFISQDKLKICSSILISILGEKVTTQNTLHCFVYFLKSITTKLDQLSCDRDGVYVRLHVVNFSFTMLHHRTTG